MPVAIVGIVCLLSGCVQHFITPARSYEAYAAKAAATAEAALSSVETVLLIAETASDGKSFGTFVRVSLSEQEDALDGIQSGFRSIQPPDARSAELRAELDAVLSDALTHVADVRIAARRDGLDDLDVVAAPLRADADALSAIAERLT